MIYLVAIELFFLSKKSLHHLDLIVKYFPSSKNFHLEQLLP